MVRDYHGLNWDVQDNPANLPTWPLAANGVNWHSLYSNWSNLGFEVNVSIMINGNPPAQWPDLAANAYAYGQHFSGYFGPGNQALAASMEVGNEPHLTVFTDAEYRTVFRNMAQGVRDADPNLLVVTANSHTLPTDEYARQISILNGLEGLYDVINVHSYAIVGDWPGREQTFPEDTSVNDDFLRTVTDLIAWRNANAPGKQIWLTEFGWDACSAAPEPVGGWENWNGSVSETAQAQYIARAFLVFAGHDLDRAYLYWFNDDDKAIQFGCAGIFRNHVRKPSFHAMRYLFQQLGAFSVNPVQTVAGDAYVYALSKPANPGTVVWAVWSPTGSGRTASFSLDLQGRVLNRAEALPLADGPAPAVSATVANGQVSFMLSETPTFLWLSVPAVPSDGGVVLDAAGTVDAAVPPDAGGASTDAGVPVNANADGGSTSTGAEDNKAGGASLLGCTAAGGAWWPGLLALLWRGHRQQKTTEKPRRPGCQSRQSRSDGQSRPPCTPESDGP